MRIALFTNEYPPNVYGGAGVHVEYLARELARLDGGAHSIQVFAFGQQDEHHGNLKVHGIPGGTAVGAKDPRHERLLDALFRNIVMVGAVEQPDIVHCHTWYSHLAGCLARPLTGARLVLTTHSLEPHRPWKVEQLGSAYHTTSWIERTAYQNADGVVAVSEAMKHDVQTLYAVAPERVRVIHNGIDPAEYRVRRDEETLRAAGVDPAIPIVLFVGRITRQKGILHLVRAIPLLDGDVQIVLCAGAPDTPEIAAEMAALIEDVRRRSAARIVWIDQMLAKAQLITLYSHAAVFVCPSVYEPFGIINLEAMACETPVVASKVGGIPEIVVDGQTGLLVSFATDGQGTFEPRNPEEFSAQLAASVNELIRDPRRCERMGKAARARVLERFTWSSVAHRTLDFYHSLLGGSSKPAS